MRNSTKFSFLVWVIAATVFFGISVVQAGDKFKDLHKGWSFEKSLPKNFKKHGYIVTRQADGHPVRDGQKSMRFEVRAGDCSWSDGWSDCEKDRERHELKSKKTWNKGEYWYHWSIYLPDDYPIIAPVKVALAQFHQKKSHVVWMFQNGYGGYFVDNQTTDGTVEKVQILTDNEMRGKWSDVLVHVRWTHNADGFFNVYVNGETTPRYRWTGYTKKKGKRTYFKLGIYRTYVSREPDGAPTQIFYYDHVNHAKTCDRTTRYFDCEAILANRAN